MVSRIGWTDWTLRCTKRYASGEWNHNGYSYFQTAFERASILNSWCCRPSKSASKSHCEQLDQVVKWIIQREWTKSIASKREGIENWEEEEVVDQVHQVLEVATTQHHQVLGVLRINIPILKW